MLERCFELAQQAKGLTSPNPMVGAVIVGTTGNVIGEGFHHKAGGNHAEVEALSNCKESPEGATLYCNLEPCCHLNKRTPPCTLAIIKSGIKKVVIAQRDPNPEVAGGGVEQLRSAGIEVEITEEWGKRAFFLNEAFNISMVQKRPMIHLKWAQTLDGKFATISGDSKWITNFESRREAHRLRFESDGILVGRETLNCDDPKLTVRHVESFGKQPWRIVCGNLQKINSKAALFNDEFKDKTIVWDSAEHLDLEQCLRGFYLELKGTSILVEGGPKLIESFLKKGLYDKISIFTAPMMLGEGRQIYCQSVDKMDDALRFSHISMKNISNNSYLTGYHAELDKVIQKVLYQ